jgi:release factor family 10
MCECRGVTRPHPTEIPYLLAFFPSLRAASDRTLSVYFPIRADSYNGRFYDLEFRRLTEKHRHKFSDKDMEVVERELPRIKAQLAVLRPTGCPFMAAFADEPKGLLRLIRLPEESEDRFEVDPPLLAPLELMLRKHPPSLIVIVHKEQAQTFATILDEVIPQHHFEGTSVKHIRSGGNKNPNLQHKEENRVKANMAAVVRIIDREVSAVSYKRLYLAGPDEAVAELEKLLPPSLKKIIAGRLSASLDRSVGELEVDLRKQLSATRA